MNDPNVSPVELSTPSDASNRTRSAGVALDSGRAPLRILVAEDNGTLAPPADAGPAARRS